MSKVALVTGANRGIGKEIARQLGKQGFHVLIGARDPKRGEEVVNEFKQEGIKAEAVGLDVTNQTSVDQAVQNISQRHGKLDVLVNNAGIAIESVTGLDTNLEDVQKTIEANFYGPFRVMKSFVPLIEKSGSGQIINVSSTLGSLTKNSDPAWDFSAVKFVGYNSSKAALNMLTVIAADQLKPKNIKVNAVCPGYVATDLNKHQGHRTVEQGAAIAVKLATEGEAAPTGGFFDDAGRIPW